MEFLYAFIYTDTLQSVSDVQYSFRSFTLRNNNNEGNIRLAGGTGSTFLLNGTNSITLMKMSDGDWCEIACNQP